MKRKQPRDYFGQYDEEFSNEASSIYDRMTQEEGFDQDQALAIAMTQLGKHRGRMDTSGSEDELSIHRPEPIQSDLVEDIRTPRNGPR